MFIKVNTVLCEINVYYITSLCTYNAVINRFTKAFTLEDMPYNEYFIKVYSIYFIMQSVKSLKHTFYSYTTAYAIMQFTFTSCN